MTETRWGEARETFDNLLAQRHLVEANNLAMRVANQALVEDARHWRAELWRSFFSKLDRDYIAQYQSYDFETCDYELYSPLDGMLLFRGPAPPRAETGLRKGIVILGAAQLFGRFQRTPFHKIIAPQIRLPVLNLSLGGAGPAFFLQPRLLSYARTVAGCVVLQVLSGRSVGCDEYPGMRMTARAGTSDQQVDRLELLSELWAEDRERCKDLVRRWQANYVRLMTELIGVLGMPVVLVWISERSPADWSTSRLDQKPDFGAFPQLIDSKVVDALKSKAAMYIELPRDDGLPHGFTSRIDGSPCPVFAPDGQLIWSNSYYSSAAAHQELSRQFVAKWPDIRRQMIAAS